MSGFLISSSPIFINNLNKGKDKNYYEKHNRNSRKQAGALSNVVSPIEWQSEFLLCSPSLSSYFHRWLNIFFPACVCKGPWSLPGGGRGHTQGVLQRHRGRQRRGPVLEEGHLQGHLQTGQRGPRGLQVPQLSPRASTRVNFSSSSSSSSLDALRF